MWIFKNIRNSVKMNILLLLVFSSWTISTAESTIDKNVLQQKFSNVFYGPENANQEYLHLPEKISLDLKSVFKSCPKNDLFLDMATKHMEALRSLKLILREQRSSTEFLTLAKILRDHPKMNFNLWLKAVLSVSLERQELISLQKPNILKLIPQRFINFENIKEARSQALLPLEQRKCVAVDGSLTTDGGEEHLLWYLREDLLINYQHMYWHMTNPRDPARHPNSTNIIFDRKGELFYYFHRNILARYNTERFVNGLKRLKPIDWSEDSILEEGYVHHLAEMDAVKSWGDRLPNTVLKNISDTESVKNILYNDIDLGYLIALNGTSIPLNNIGGIDLIGNIIESSTETVNEERYSLYGIHGYGHNIMAQLSVNGVGLMDFTGVSLRDPIFYRWHVFIDDIFQSHKSQLVPYTTTDGEFPLLWSGVQIQNFRVQTLSSAVANELHTYFSNLTVSLPMSVDSQPLNDSNIDFCIKNLKHDPFEYQFTITKDKEVLSEKATMRIFMAPRLNETGERFTMDKQGLMFFAMDHFTVDLYPGFNIVTRWSNESALSLQWSFEDGDSIPPSNELPHCGCGWPQHLLIPKGTTDGMIFDLFAMITDGTEDAPEDSDNKDPVCISSHILCGKFDQLYPDTKPMGYPLDRKPYNVTTPEGESRMVEYLEEYIQPISNMEAIQVKIFHTS